MWTNVRGGNLIWARMSGVVIWCEHECPGWSFDVSTNVRPCQKLCGNECPWERMSVHLGRQYHEIFYRVVKHLEQMCIFIYFYFHPLRFKVLFLEHFLASNTHRDRVRMQVLQMIRRHFVSQTLWGNNWSNVTYITVNLCLYLSLRPKKKNSVFRGTAWKKLGRVG